MKQDHTLRACDECILPDCGCSVHFSETEKKEMIHYCTAHAAAFESLTALIQIKAVFEAARAQEVFKVQYELICQTIRRAKGGQP